MKQLAIFLFSLNFLIACGGDSDPSPQQTRSGGFLERTDETRLGAYFQAAVKRDQGNKLNTGGADGAEAAADSTSAPASSGGAAGDFSGTNLQESGVDEADLIKTDGRYIYSIDKAEQPYTLGPADEPIYNNPNPHSIRIMDTQDGLTPVQRIESPSGNWALSGLYLTKDTRQLVALSSPGGDYWGNWFYPSYFANQKTDLLFIDVEDPANASIKNQLHFDGSLIASRRVGDALYLALRHYPEVYPVDAPGGDGGAKDPADDTRTADDFLPDYSLNDETKRPAVVPENCFLEKDASGTADIITLVAVDLSADTPVFNSQCYVGSAEALYSSTEALYLATTRYDYSWSGDSAEYDNGVTTDIHKFAFDTLDFDYRGSAEVRGHLGWHQDRKSFRFSEKDGLLRVLTFAEDLWTVGIAVDDGIGITEGGSGSGSAEGVAEAPENIGGRSTKAADPSPVLLTILKEDPGTASLQVVSQLPNKARPAPIGLPGEQLYASRFIGDRAYLVTFRVTDPLYVLDLSNPSDPYIAGELKVDGYSDYLHPISDTLLLGVGKDAIPDETQWGDGRGAWYQGVKLSLIDVSDPANPREAAKVVLGKRGTEATVLLDHHGLTGLPDGDSYRVALPVALHERDKARPDQPRPWDHYGYTHAGLYRFDISVPNQTITAIPPLVATDYLQYEPGQRVDNDRSVIIGDDVHYLHWGRFWSQDWAGQGAIIGPQ